MQIIVNGTDLSPYISVSGLSGQISGVNAPEAGRVLDTTMYTLRVGIKRSMQVTTRAVTDAERIALLNALSPEYLTVRYTDVETGRLVTREMYTNNIEWTYLRTKRDGTDLFVVSFPLIER